MFTLFSCMTTQLLEHLYLTPGPYLVVGAEPSGSSHKSPPSPLWQLKAPEDPGSQAVAGTGNHRHWEPSRP